ncbi:hypothetical protein SAMN05444339_10290 [Loktanella atrilutea]|uniref:Uncharacterized protein n=1 Tax=Loktanella atrilutea TaxID=366533 RepID=A0A1M4WEX4_LOKAT|nr:hypothetical protein [Loktanella atrilutea]SHE79710.1 hypothetical protein SAMN05444339_10290 [Loktanella atrilutea]
MATETRRIIPRNGTLLAWTNVNPTLAAGEFGVESDTGKFKIGNGTLPWNQLPYANSAVGGEGPPGQDGANGAPGEGVPIGGQPGDTLVKTASDDYAATWVPGVVTDTEKAGAGTEIRNIVALTQAEYDALPVKDPQTLYHTYD